MIDNNNELTTSMQCSNEKSFSWILRGHLSELNLFFECLCRPINGANQLNTAVFDLICSIFHWFIITLNWMNNDILVNVSHAQTHTHTHLDIPFVGTNAYRRWRLSVERVADRVFELSLSWILNTNSHRNFEWAKEKVQKSTNFELPPNLLRS